MKNDINATCNPHTVRNHHCKPNLLNSINRVDAKQTHDEGANCSGRAFKQKPCIILLKKHFLILFSKI